MPAPAGHRQRGNDRGGAPGSAATFRSEQPGTGRGCQPRRAPPEISRKRPPAGRPGRPSAFPDRREGNEGAVAVSSDPQRRITEDWASSRLSETNRADDQNGEFTLSARRSRKRPLTERDDVTLRAECRDVGAIEADRPISWNRTISQWRHYVEDRDGIEAVFQNEQGETARGSDPHRFDPEYADKQYAKLKDLERGVSEDYGKRLHTAMLSLTASAAPDGDPVPPVDHLDELLSSWEAVRRALSRSLDDHRFARLGILEPHPGDGVNNGYFHVHIAVFVDGQITADDLAPVIEAHVRNCDLAEWDAHDLDDDSTISVRHAGLDRDQGDPDDDHLDELAIYLAEYLGTYGDDDPLDEAEHVQAANALLWASNRQRWRPCQTAQQFMAYDGSESDGEWSLIGVEDDGDLIPCDGSSGGVDTFTTGALDPPD